MSPNTSFQAITKKLCYNFGCWLINQIVARTVSSPQSWNKAQAHAVDHWQRLTDCLPFRLSAAAIATGRGGIWVCCVFTASVCVDTAAIATF